MGINLSKVNYTYGSIKKRKKPINFILKDINIQIEQKDEFVALVGHTGSGKSTLVQLLNLLNKPTYGEITSIFENEENNDNYKIIGCGNKTKIGYSKDDINKIKFNRKALLKPLRKNVGLVFQFPEYQVFEETALKDIMFGPLNFGKNEEEAKQAALDIAEKIGITNILESSPFALSGGQMRKVAIAGILASNPNVLILDEPTVGLDPLAKTELLNFLKKLNEEEHKTIIIITHDMDVVSKYVKRVIVLNNGEIKYDGSKEDLFKDDKIINNNHLSLPTIVKTLKELKEKLSLNDLDEYQYNVDDAFNEIRRVIGENNE